MVTQSRSDTRPPVSIAAGILLVFLAVGLICLWLPITSLTGMLSSIISNDTRVIIDKGTYYLFGGGIALLVLLVDGFYNAVLKRKIPPNLTRLVSRGAIVGLVMILALPPLAHYPTAHYLARHGYLVCEAQSRQWLFMRTIVYTQSDDSCTESG